MTKQLSLKIIMIIAFAGILFSGYLSYYELFAGGCSKAIISCGARSTTIASLPACIYGFIMYTIIFVISFIGYKIKGKPKLP